MRICQVADGWGDGEAKDQSMSAWWKRQAKPQRWVQPGSGPLDRCWPGQKHLLPAQDRRLWEQGKGWKRKSTECYVFGSSRELGSRESTKEAEGLLSPGYPPELLLHSAFGLVYPDQPHSVFMGSVGHLGVAWAPWGRFL